MGEKLKSRKLWIAVLGAALMAFNAGLGSPVSQETVTQTINLLIVYLGAQGAVDAVTAYKGGA